jgi:Protein of unknown function (DUF3568)
MSKMWLKAANWRVAHLLIMAVALANSGCLAAAIGGVAAAGGVAGYAYYKGGLAKDFNASVDNSWAAAKTSLQELQLPVVAEKRTDNGGFIDSRTGDGQNVRISFETLPVKIPAEGPRTDISVRAAGLFGDRPLSERVLAQISGHLAPAPPLASAPPPGGLVPAVVETPAPPVAPPQAKP